MDVHGVALRAALRDDRPVNTSKVDRLIDATQPVENWVLVD